MAHKNFTSNGRAANFLAALLALGVWEAAARILNNRLLLVGPLTVALRLMDLIGEKTFWQAVSFTFTRITAGFLLAFFLAQILAALAARFPLVETLLRPYLTAIQTVPVASFIVIALLWLSGRKLSIFISFLMVLPVLYTNLLHGIKAADPQLLEMARVFRLSPFQRVRGVYLPAMESYLLSACHVALGMCWKSGVAAEVIGVCSGSIGGMLYDSKVYLEISDLFAWTVVIVAVSVCFEKLFIRILKQGFRTLEVLE